MNKHKRIVKNQITGNTAYLYLVMIFICILIFFVLGRNRGYVLYKDSVAYTADDMYRAFGFGIMPGYYFFVKMVRSVFGEELYLNIVAIIQGVLASVSTLCFTMYVRKEFKLDFKDTIIVFLFSVIPYCYSLPEEVATHAIMTESIAFPLFYVFVTLALKGLYNKSSLYAFFSLICAIVLVFIRKQHILLFFVSLVLLVFIAINKSKFDVKRLKLLCFIGIFAAVSVLFISYVYLYPQKHNASFDQITYSFTSKVIYMSDEADADQYIDQDEKNIFELLYKHAESEKMLYSYAEESGDFRWRHAINGMNYTMRSVWKDVITYCRDNGYPDNYTMVLMKGVLFRQIKIHPLRFIYIICIPMGQSLISAIFIKPDKIYYLCAIISALLYITSFCICIRNRKDNDKRPYNLYVFTMLILVLNIVSLNILFQSLQRYVVYTAGLFYVAVYINILHIMRNTSKNHLGKEYISEVNS